MDTIKTTPAPTEKKKYPRRRSSGIYVMLTEKEREMIERRMKQAGITTLRAFITKMAIDGRVIRIELDSVREMVRLLSNATNNINQIAKRANQTSSIYSADLDELRVHYEDIWVQAKEILKKLAAL